jgi:hypothetical protein
VKVNVGNVAHQFSHECDSVRETYVDSLLCTPCSR